MDAALNINRLSMIVDVDGDWDDGWLRIDCEWAVAAVNGSIRPTEDWKFKAWKHLSEHMILNSHDDKECFNWLDFTRINKEMHWIIVFHKFDYERISTGWLTSKHLIQTC